MASIMAPLVSARDDVETFREKIDHFPFSLVTPLRAQNDKHYS